MASPFVWGAGGAQMTPEAIANQRKVSQALMAQGMDYSPVKHWTQGAARVSQALLGGYEGYRADEAEKANRTADQELIAALMGGASPATTPAATPAAAPAGDPGEAIAGIESGGRYDALGPVTKAGDRAYGKYQVMGANIPQWTKAHLGREMTPEQFLADQQAQDAVFKGQFGQYSGKYGPEGAARAWFAGEGGMNDMGRKDQLGTTVADYGAKFTRGMGGDSAVPAGAMAQGAPVQMAQAAAPTSGRPSPAVIQALTSPYVGEGPKKIAQIMLAQQLKRDDYDIQQRPDGTVIAVSKTNPNDIRTLNAPGAGQSAIKFEADKAAAIAKAKGEAEKLVGQAQRTKEEQQVANIVVQDIDRAIKTMDTAILPTTGTAGALLSNIGNTAARDVAGLVDTVKANAGFAELQKMRNNSPTGGALGQVSEREIAYLQSTIGNLEQSQSEDQFKDNLRRVKNTYLDIIHGEGKGPPREKLTFQEQKGEAKPAPKAGEIIDGYRFKGGDPSKPESWEQVL